MLVTGRLVDSPQPAQQSYRHGLAYKRVPLDHRCLALVNNHRECLDQLFGALGVRAILALNLRRHGGQLAAVALKLAGLDEADVHELLVVEMGVHVYEAHLGQHLQAGR
jgi:hypothetical protein